jgi:hypothetical protein
MNVILEEIVTIMKLVSKYRYRLLITPDKFGVVVKKNGRTDNPFWRNEIQIDGQAVPYFAQEGKI